MRLITYVRKAGYLLGFLYLYELISLWQKFRDLAQPIQEYTKIVPQWWNLYVYPYATDIRWILFLLNILVLWQLFRFSKWGAYALFVFEIIQFLIPISLVLTFLNQTSSQFTLLELSFFEFLWLGLWLWAFKRKWSLFS